MSKYLRLQNGSDVRGVALEGVDGEPVTLTEECAEAIAKAFCVWLIGRTGQTRVRVAIGHDSRLSAPALSKAVERGVLSTGHDALLLGLATTPSTFNLLHDEDFYPLPVHGSIMITASHLPFHRNGLKFFWKKGGLGREDVTEILRLAETYRFSEGVYGKSEERPYLDRYAQTLVHKVREACGCETPLSGKKIVVDAGNGAGGFFADKVLVPLGANVDGSQFLEPDGRFPNHMPNPENAEAMRSVCEAVKAAHADMGIIFDTDVDRAAAVDKNGNEINRNRLIALISAILLQERAGTIVTDSVTSDGLTKFIEARGGRHHRFKRGYKNVIDEACRLNESGEYAPLAIETSGHAALKENRFLDDGAYLIVRLLIATAQAAKDGKELSDLIADLEEPLESAEIRIKILTDDFQATGKKVLAAFEESIARSRCASVAPHNYEGCRVNYDKKHGDGWALLRMSLHDPVIPINIESQSKYGVFAVAKSLYYFLREYPELDIRSLQTYMETTRAKLLNEVRTHAKEIGCAFLWKGKNE